MNSLKLLNSRLLGVLSSDVETKFGMSRLFSTVNKTKCLISVNVVPKIVISSSCIVKNYSTKSNDVAIEFPNLLCQRIFPKSKPIESKIDNFDVELDGSAVTLVKTLQETFEMKHSAQMNEEDFRSQAANKPSELRSSSDFDIDVERGTTLRFLIVKKALRMPSIRGVITRTYCTKNPREPDHSELDPQPDKIAVLMNQQMVPLSLLLEERRLKTKVEERLNSASKVIWRETSRAAIEYYIDRYGKNAIVDYKKIPEAPNEISWFERSRIVRETKLNWILKNKSSELPVKLLIGTVNNSGEFKSLEEFTCFLSMAYDELSDQLKTRLINPDLEEYDFRKVVVTPEANRAVRVFMSRFDFSTVTVTREDTSDKPESIS